MQNNFGLIFDIISPPLETSKIIKMERYINSGIWTSDVSLY